MMHILGKILFQFINLRCWITSNRIYFEIQRFLQPIHIRFLFWLSHQLILFNRIHSFVKFGFDLHNGAKVSLKSRLTIPLRFHEIFLIMSVLQKSIPRHSWFLEPWNREKSLCNIRHRFSYLLDKWITKISKKKFFHGGFLR